MKMPKKILLYVCDHEQDGTPILAVANKLDDIPEDSNGDAIGEYELICTSTLTVTRELITQVARTQN
jgi:hypothetical protein